jgi:tetratricopeptide (TPR) repeat protein
MAEEKQQPDRDDQTQPAAGAPHRYGPDWEAAPVEGEVFETPFDLEPMPDDPFPPLAESGSEAAAADVDSWARAVSPGEGTLSRLSRLPGAMLHMWDLGRLSRVQKALVVGILINAVVVSYLVQTPAPLIPDPTASAPAPGGDDPSPPQARPGVAAQGPVAVASAPASTETEVQGPADSQRDLPRLETLPGPEPLSLQLADKLYLHRDFEHAQVMYDKLHRRLPATQDNQPLRDFLLLRMALCGKNGGNIAPADALLRTVSLSRLPILRALARYHQSTMLLGRQRYLEATAKAYQTIALIEVAAHDQKWTSAVQRECGFLAAEAMTRNLLSLCDADANLPRELWGEHPDVDPFVDMDEPQLRVFLASGADQLEATVLSPQIRRREGKAAVPRWSVICNGASIEELLARFAANAGVNIRWTEPARAAATPDPGPEGPRSRSGPPGPSASGLRVGGEDNVRARPVHLYLTSATTAQIVTTAAGSVGLLARTEDNGGLRLLDPTSYSSLADHTSLLAEEAITLWQRFLLAAESDPRAANAHFALALLQAARGQFDQAVAEYKLVANRFAMHALAPYALLQSGMLKVRLRDYTGAHTDLRQLVELYPETELSDRACLYLADATMKAGLYEEASGLYRKVYNLGLSAAAQTESAWGAGRCLYETGRYEEAAEWLNRYTTLARDPSRPAFSAACLLLGQAYLALHRPSQAQAALRLALRGELSHQQHVQTITVLVKTYLEQGLFLEALGVLENTGGWQLSQQEAVELALLRVQALRSIGLADSALGLLQEKSQYLPNPELQAKVALELARCQVAADNLEAARKTLGPVFETVEPGPLADQIGRELALVCLHLGQTEQAVSVCALLLKRAAASERPALLALLADAYRRQGKLDQAMAATLNQYEVAADPNIAPSIRNN